MNTINELIQNDPTRPKKIKLGGRYTKKFLTWNRRKVVKGETTTYLGDKLYNLKTQSWINRPIDKRTKNRKLKKSFLEKYDIYGSTFTKKNTNIYVFEYVKDVEVGGNYSYEDSLNSNLLLQKKLY